MPSKQYILAIDQGTTSSRAIVFDADMRPQGSAQEEFAQHFPRSGWVEHAPEDLWQTVLRSCEGALRAAGISAQLLQESGSPTSARQHCFGTVRQESRSTMRLSGKIVGQAMPVQR